MEIVVNKIKLYYEIKGEGKNILLIHGNGEDHTIFKELINNLAKDYRVIACDTRNHGLSKSSDKLSYQIFMEDYVALIKALKLDNLIIYGFSDGGIIALLIAIYHQDLVSKIIISGANLNPYAFKLKDYFNILFDYLKYHRPLDLLMLKEPHIKYNDLKKIKSQVIVVAGEYDCVRLSHTTKIAKNIKHSKLMIIKGENHSSYIINSPKIANIIRPYL